MLSWTSNHYTSGLLRKNPDKFFVFGDNLQRVGHGGQAVIRDEPNALGVATKVSPGIYFSDDVPGKNMANNFVCWEYYRDDINKDLARVEDKLVLGNTVIIPLAFIGTGLARLPEYAPGLLFYLYHRFNLFMHKYGVSYEQL